MTENPASQNPPPPHLRRRFPRWVGLLAAGLIGMTLGILLLAYLTAGDIYDYQDLVDGVHLPEVDAIVVLAGGRGRIAAAGDIWYRYWELSQGVIKDAGPNPVPAQPPILFISGMGHQAHWNILSRQLRRGVFRVIKPENVIMETESSNTEANARFLARYAKARGWERILLMTSPYHMKRARSMFSAVLRAAGTPMQVDTLSVYQEPFEPHEWRHSLTGVRVTVFEYLKLLYYKYFWKP